MVNLKYMGQVMMDGITNTVPQNVPVFMTRGYYGEHLDLPMFRIVRDLMEQVLELIQLSTLDSSFQQYCQKILG